MTEGKEDAGKSIGEWPSHEELSFPERRFLNILGSKIYGAGPYWAGAEGKPVYAMLLEWMKARQEMGLSRVDLGLREKLAAFPSVRWSKSRRMCLVDRKDGTVVMYELGESGYLTEQMVFDADCDPGKMFDVVPNPNGGVPHVYPKDGEQ